MEADEAAQGDARAVTSRRPGSELASARERAGIGLESMAGTLRLSVRQLEALEADDYASLPPPTFVRGYLRAFAREVDLDENDIIAAYDALGLGDEQPDLRVSHAAEPAHSGRGAAFALVVVLLVVVAGLGGWWWQSREPSAVLDDDMAATSGEAAMETGSAESDAAGAADAAEAGVADAGAAAEEAPGTGDDSEAAAASGGTEADTVVAQASGADVDTGASGPTAGNEGGAETTTAAESSGDTAGSEDTVAADTGTAASASAQGVTDDGATAQPAADEASGGADSGESTDQGTAETVGTAETEGAAAEYEPPNVTASAEAATAPAAAEGPDMLVLNMNGRSWIEVKDARGRQLVYTLYSGSAPLRLKGWAPFNVFLGNSPAVAIEFNGESVEKSAFTRSDRTAAFLVDAGGARRR